MRRGKEQDSSSEGGLYQVRLSRQCDAIIDSWHNEDGVTKTSIIRMSVEHMGAMRMLVKECVRDETAGKPVRQVGSYNEKGEFVGIPFYLLNPLFCYWADVEKNRLKKEKPQEDKSNNPASKRNKPKRLK